MIAEKENSVLIVDDEPEIGNAISNYLSQLKFNCKTAVDLATAREFMKHKVFDFVILDMHLPDGHGIEFLRKIQQSDFAGRILILSSQNSEPEIVNGLNAGGDDYIVKPFSLPELAARINNLKKSRTEHPLEIISYREIKIEKKEQKVCVNEVIIHLTKSEFELLLFMIDNPRMVLTHYSIARHLFNNNNSVESIHEVVYSHIKNLKKKIGAVSDQTYITAVYGIGYKLI